MRYCSNRSQCLAQCEQSIPYSVVAHESYYDLTNKYCNDVWGQAWADKDINHGIPFCSGQQAVKLSDLGTNRIVGGFWIPGCWWANVSYELGLGQS